MKRLTEQDVVLGTGYFQVKLNQQSRIRSRQPFGKLATKENYTIT
ncbi:MAG TPA: hypothetical protein V6D28_28335 [Leptolyngbyaceae cyanobacterium]